MIIKTFSVLLVTLILFTVDLSMKNQMDSNDSKPSEKKAGYYFSLADSFLFYARYDSARYYYNLERDHFKDNPEQKIRYLNSIAYLDIKTCQFSQAWDSVQKALKIAQSEYGKDHNISSVSYRLMAQLYRKYKADYTNAMKYILKSVYIDSLQKGMYSPEMAKDKTEIAKIYFEKRAIEKALENYHTSYKINLKNFGKNDARVANDLYHIGTCQYFLEHYDAANDTLNQALSIQQKAFKDNHPDMGGIYIILGDIYEMRNDRNKALQLFKKSLEIDRSFFGPKHEDVMQDYTNIAIIYDMQRDYNRSNIYFKKAADLAHVIFGDDHPKTASAYDNLGINYKNLGDYDKSIEYHLKALAICLKIFGPDNMRTAYSYANLGISYKRKKEYPTALDYEKKSQVIDEKHYGRESMEVATDFQNLGDISLLLGRNNDAIYYFKNAADITIKQLGDKNWELAQSYQGLGQTLEKKDNYEQALLYYQKALIALVEKFNDNNIYVNPVVENISDLPDLPFILNDKARTLYKYYKRYTKNEKNLQASVTTFDLSISLFERIKTDFQSEASKLILSEDTYDVYKKAFRSALEAYKLTGKDRYKEDAFAISEKSKASILFQSLHESQYIKDAQIPDSLYDLIKQLNSKQTQYEISLNSTGQQDKAKTSNLENEIFKIQQKRDSLYKYISNAYPKYYALKNNFKTFSVAEIQKTLLDTNKVIIEYFFADSSLNIITITSNSFDIRTNKKIKNLNKRIDFLRKGIINQDFNLYTENAYALYQMLVLPVSGIIHQKELIIIPDGRLSLIPFDALISVKPGSDSKDYRALNYLINDFQISYNYSAALLIQDVNTKIVIHNNDLLGFAPVDFN